MNNACSKHTVMHLGIHFIYIVIQNMQISWQLHCTWNADPKELTTNISKEPCPQKKTKKRKFPIKDWKKAKEENFQSKVGRKKKERKFHELTVKTNSEEGTMKRTVKKKRWNKRWRSEKGEDSVKSEERTKVKKEDTKKILLIYIIILFCIFLLGKYYINTYFYVIHIISWVMRVYK